jgi:hypothetical protein
VSALGHTIAEKYVETDSAGCALERRRVAGEDHAESLSEYVDPDPQMNEATKAGLTVRRESRPTPIAISIRPNMASHMVASCERKFVM